MGLLVAVRFLTVLPVPLGNRATVEGMGSSLGYFPLVGLLLGLVLAGLDRGLQPVLPSPVVNGLLVVTLVALTGAIHMDGLMDTCDGLAGGRTLQQRREIMRDSRIGAFGAIGAFCLLLLKYVSLEGLTESSRFGALVLMPALGRWTAVFSIYAFPYARGEGLGRAFKDQATWPILVVATAFVVGVSVGFLALKGLALVAGVGLVSLVVAAVLSHRFAGLTGDNYGAVTEVAEVVALLLVIAIPAWSW